MVSSSIFSAASGVITMQALLYAVGLGSSSIPMAAGLNWVIKDGLGQLGGVLFASSVNTRFDAEPKYWRMVAAGALGVAGFVEVLTPLAPSLFVPLAGIANASKNISWLSASAARASIHRSFIRHENLADVTAKAGSQTIAASLIGTTLGISVSPLIGSDFGMPLITTFCSFAAIHLYCQYKSLEAVILPTLNKQRALLATDSFVNGNNRVKTPAETAELERFVPVPFYDKLNEMYNRKKSRNRGVGGSDISIGQSMESLFISPSTLHNIAHILDKEKYIVGISFEKEGIVSTFLHLRESANDQDILYGFLHACRLHFEFHKQGKHSNRSNNEIIRVIETSYTWTLSEAKDELRGTHDDDDDDAMCRREAYVKQLKTAGWNLDNLFLETCNVKGNRDGRIVCIKETDGELPQTRVKEFS
eukprot:g5345.t1